MSEYTELFAFRGLSDEEESEDDLIDTDDVDDDDVDDDDGEEVAETEEV
jgi:hypothetical protein